MSDLSMIPLQDGFETQLSQEWNGATGTVYVLATPTYTPITTDTYIIVSPGKTNMQIARVTTYDSTLKTLTVDSISFNKALGVSSTAQTHSTGSKVIISDNYQFWADIQTAINSKADITYVDGIAIAGAGDASTTLKGLTRLSTSPNVTIGTATMTIASPCVVSFTSHGLTVNDSVQFTTTGTLPIGITASINYYVISAGLTANAFEISATYGGSAINTTGSQSGTHTLIKTTPVAVGTLDTRVPTQAENDALVGNNTDVPVGSGNKLITQTGFQHASERYAVISSASSTAYVVTLSPAPTSLTSGMPFKAKIDVANTTTTPTVNVNGIGAKTIVKGVNTALAIGDMPVNLIADFVYNGTNVVLLNPLTTIPFTNGVTTRTADTASGTQTIAHGGGKVPKFVELSANCINAVSGTVSNTARSEGCYNGTTNSCVYEAFTLGNGAGSNALTAGNSNTQGIYIQQSGTAGNTQVGVITVDATNITITWTKTGTLAANPINILWKASF